MQGNTSDHHKDEQSNKERWWQIKLRRVL